MDESCESKTIFNNSLSKKTFFKLVDVHFNTSLFREKRSTIHHVKNIDQQQVDILNLTKTQKKYEIKIKNGKSILILVENYNKRREVLPFKVIYDLLIKSHIEDNGHEISYIQKVLIQNKYVIPNVCFELIPKACNVCKAKSEISFGASKTGYVTFIDNILNKEAYHNSILVYVDEYTEFMIIRPTLSDDETDTVTELFKIFMEFGPPEQVYINLNNSENTCKMTKMMHNLCPSCSIIIQKFSNVYQDEVCFRVLEAIGAWMTETKSSSWELGCSIIQNSLNNRVKRQLKTNVSITARNLFFNHSILDPINTDTLSDIESDTLSDIESDSDDDCPLIELMNVITDDKDPLATGVEKINIQGKSSQRRRKKDTIKNPGKDAEINSKIIDTGNNKKSIEIDKLIKKILDKPTVYKTADKNTERQNIKSNENERDTDTEKATGSNEGVDELLDEAAFEELNIELEEISGIELDVKDIVNITEGNTEIASTSDTGTATGIKEYSDDDDDGDIDFGSEL